MTGGYPNGTGGMTGYPNGTGGTTGYPNATGGMTGYPNGTGGTTGYPNGTGGMTGYPTGSMTTAAPSLLTSIGVWLRDVKYKIEMFLVSLFYKVYSFVTYPIVMLVNALGGGERSLSSVGSQEEMYQHAST